MCKSYCAYTRKQEVLHGVDSALLHASHCSAGCTWVSALSQSACCTMPGTYRWLASLLWPVCSDGDYFHARAWAGVCPWVRASF